MYANICPAHHASGTRSSDDTLYEQFIFYVNHKIHEKSVPLLHIKGLLHVRASPGCRVLTYININVIFEV